MRYLVAAALLVCACATVRPVDGDSEGAPDLLSAVPDPTGRPLVERDLGSGGSPPDLAIVEDLAPPSPPDLAPVADLTPPSSSPSDLAPAMPANAADTCASAPLLPTGVDVMGQDTT